MKAFAKMLSEETLNELKGKLGEDLTKQINDKLGDYAINPGKEKLIPKAVYDEDKASLRAQIEDRDKQLGELKKASKDNADLQAKITELQDSIKAKDTEYQTTLTKTRQDYAYNSALSGVKAKNPKALAGLIDKSKITYEDDGSGGYTVKGLTEQIEGLKKTDSYLFEGYEQGKPVPQNPPTPAPNAAADNDLRKNFGLNPVDGK